MSLTEIIKATAVRVEQYATVTIDPFCQTVEIAAVGEDDIFLQGENAQNFIDATNDLYERSGDVTRDEAAQCHAEQYIECLWG